MGERTVADDSTVHPLVADALARRTGAHGEHSGSSTGWPDPPPGGGGGVGWPDDTDPAPDGAPQEPADSGATRAAAPVPLPAPMVVRRTWRRLSGASPAA